MTELVSSYGGFIQQAFIDPIRSVLIIDDKYPTIEQILTNQINGEQQKIYEKPQQILNVVKGFRDDNPGLIVDIHDGSADAEEELAKYLHQSDLLILDYELYGDSGEKSIEIAKKILANAHFNLIVVHTDSDPQEPFEKNLLALLSPCESLQADNYQTKISRATEIIEAAENEDPDVSDKIKNTIQFEQYRHFRHPKNQRALRDVTSGTAPYGDFKSLCDAKGWERSIPTEIFLWALSEYEKTNQGFFSAETAVAANWSQASDKRLWVRSDKGFITFVKKNDEIKLLEELKISLEDWSPSPSRLLSSKLRAEFDDQGVIAEDRILGNKLLHAKFYEDLYAKKTDESRRVAIDNQVGRQLEDMGNLVKANVTPYMNELIKADKPTDGDSELIKTYGVNLGAANNTQDAIVKVNTYVSCCTEVSGWHLAPGHILNVNDEKWICLSPACDLIPGQKTSIGIYGDVGTGKPFMAVKLHKRNGTLGPNEINSNNFLFLPSESNDVDQYCFYEGSGTDPNKSVSPHWNLFIAENGGKYDPDDRRIHLEKIVFKAPSTGEAEGQVQDERTPMLQFEKLECEVVAQLRYEYALNLIQKLSSDQTRVGLGYISS